MLKLLTVILVVFYFAHEGEAIASAMSHHSEIKELVCFFINFVAQCTFCSFFIVSNVFLRNKALIWKFISIHSIKCRNSTIFQLWKICGNAQLSQSFTRNSVATAGFPHNFHTRKFGWNCAKPMWKVMKI